MEISFAKRYRIYEKSTIATDYNNLLGDKPKSANDQNRENKLIQKQQIQPKSISPRAFARPSTTALVYKQTNNLIKPTIKTSDKKPNRTNTAIDYNRNTNLYYASPVNSDFFENIRLNEIKIYSKQNSQRNDTVYTSPPSPISKVPNNIKLKQQILNQYYANETNISPNTGLSLKSNATTTTATSKLASYLQKSKLSNEEINKYLSYKKVDNSFLDPVLNLNKKISTNDNNKNKTNFTNNLSSSFSSFYNSNYLEKTTRMQSRLLNFNTSTNNKQNVLNRSRNNIGTSSFNNNNLKKKFNQLTTSRPVSDFRLKSGTKTPNTPPQQTQKPNQMKSNSFNKYFDEKYLKQRTAIQQQQQQQLAKLKTDTNNDASKKAAGSIAFKKYDTSSDSELNGRMNITIINRNEIKNYDDDSGDDDDEIEEDEDEFDEARLNQLLAEDAAMMSMNNKKCNEWLEKYFNSNASSPVNEEDEFFGCQT